MKLPVELPAGWSAEEAAWLDAIVITAVKDNKICGFVTVSQKKRSYVLGMCPILTYSGRIYKGQKWRAQLFTDAINVLHVAMWASRVNGDLKVGQTVKRLDDLKGDAGEVIDKSSDKIKVKWAIGWEDWYCQSDNNLIPFEGAQS